MADNAVDNIYIEIEAKTEEADKGIDKTIKYLETMQAALNGINVKKFKQEMGNFEEFQQKLKTAFKNITVSGNAGELEKQIEKAEARLDSLLKKENRLQTVSAIDKNAKPYRNLQYDIAEVCATLDKLYVKMDKVSAQKPLNFWEKPNWEKNLQEYGTTDEKAINPLSIKELDTTKIESVVSSADQLKDRLHGIAEVSSAVTASMENINVTMSKMQSAGAQTENEFSKLRNTFSSGIGTKKLNSQMQDLVDGINQAKFSLKQMESGDIEFDASKYSHLVNDLRQAQDQFKQFKESITETPKTMEDISNSIASIGNAAQQCGLGGFSSILNNIAAILPNIEIGGMAANAGFQSMAAGLQSIQAAIPVIGIILTMLTTVINMVNQAANAIKNAVQKVIASVKSMVNKIRSGIQSIINKFRELKKKVRDSLGFSEKQAGNFAKKFKMITKLFSIMLLRSAFTKLFSGITEGFNNLVVYSKKMGSEFHKNVNLLYNDIRQLGNSLATVFEPILNVVAPILDYLIQKLIAATTAISQFFAALTGKNFYTKAIKLNDDYAASLDKVSNAAKGLLGGLDELNNLNSNSGSGNTTNPGDMFETEEVTGKYKNLADKFKDAWKNADFYDLGRALGEKLKKALESIPWSKIKKTLRKIAKSIATLLNGFLETPGLFRVIGKTIAEAINSAFEFVDEFAWDFHWDSLAQAIIDAVQGVCDKLDWDVISHAVTGLAFGLVDFFNTIFGAKETWGSLGTTIAKAINTVIHGIYLFVHNFDFASFGKSVATGLGNALNSIAYWKIGRILSDGINGIFESALNFAETFPLIELAKKLADGINTAFDGIDLETVRASFGIVCKKLGSFFKQMLVGDENGNGGINWGEIGKSLMAAMVTLIEGIGNFFAEQDPEATGKKIAEFVNNAFAYLSENKESVINAVNAVIHTISDIFSSAIGGEDGIDWQNIFGTIGDIVGEIDWGAIFDTTFKAIAGAWTFERIFDITVLRSIGGSIWNSIAEGIDNALQGIADWLNEHVGEKLQSAFETIFGISGEDSPFNSFGENIVEGIKLGIKSAIPGLQTFVIFDYAKKITEWFCEVLGIASPSKEFESYGKFIVQGFINGITGKFSEVRSKIHSWGSNVKKWFKENCSYDSFKSIASDVVNGFKRGIGNCYQSCKSSVESWAGNVSTWFKNKLSIHSPSKVFQEFGKFTVSGFNKGIENAGDTTKNVMSSWADSFSSMDVECGLKLNIDDSALKGIENNYGADFDSNISRRIFTENVNKESFDSGNIGNPEITYSYGEEQEELLREQNSLLKQILEKNPDLILNGRSLLKELSKEAAISKKSSDKLIYI